MQPVGGQQPPQQPQQPSPQQYPPPYPSQYPPPYGYYYPPPQPLPPPKPSHTGRNVAIAILVVVALGLLALYVLGGSSAPLAKPQPKITPTAYDLSDQRTACYVGGTGGNVVVTFTLVNSGGNGYADIDFLVDSSVAEMNTYYVSGNGGQTPVSQNLWISDCAAHQVGIQMTAERAA